MTTISILPDGTDPRPQNYRAIAGSLHSSGKTAGAALDALTAQLGEVEGTTLIVLQEGRPDAFFSAKEQLRLRELMDRWRDARDAGTALPAADQAELEALVEAELHATSRRAASLIQKLSS